MTRHTTTPTFSIIVACTPTGVIGLDGKIPWHIKEDMHRFRSLTLGKVVIMGRKTADSIRGELDGRHVLVLSRRSTASSRWCFFTSLAYAAHRARTIIDLDPTVSREIMIAGGSEIYRQVLPLCRRVYLTLVDRDVPGDAWFPVGSLLGPEWRRSEGGEDRGGYRFLTFEREDPQ